MMIQDRSKGHIKSEMDKRIANFLRDQTNLSLATSVNNLPYCANCFYSYSEELTALLFKSNPETKHVQDALTNRNVSGTITPDKLDKINIKGIQFMGVFTEPKGEDLSIAQKCYYSKFPMAVVMKGDLWSIELTKIKMTDNTLGFGKKLIWERK